MTQENGKKKNNPLNCVTPIEIINILCPINVTSTINIYTVVYEKIGKKGKEELTKILESMEGDNLNNVTPCGGAFIYGSKQIPITAIDQNTWRKRCPICSSTNYREEYYSGHMQLAKTKIMYIIPDPSPQFGPNTKIIIDSDVNWVHDHELQHAADYTNTVVNVITPTKIIYECCKKANPEKFEIADDVIQGLKISAEQRIKKEYDDAYAEYIKKKNSEDEKKQTKTGRTLQKLCRFSCKLVI